MMEHLQQSFIKFVSLVNILAKFLHYYRKGILILNFGHNPKLSLTAIHFKFV